MADNKFTYKDYEDDDVTKTSWDRYNTLYASEPTYTDNWGGTLNDITNKVLNREKFSYDLNGDALYQQYKDQYVNQGKMAMMDTMGQAQAATGGYGNSYAQSVGQQAYQGYLQQLNDKVPELYQLALDKYNQEGQELYNQYSLVSDMSNTEYSRFRDDIADWQNALGMAFDEYWNNKNFGYGKYKDERDLAYTEYRDGKEDEQTAKDNALREAETAASLGDFSKLKDLGYDTTKAEAAYNASLAGGDDTASPLGGFSEKDFSAMMYEAFANGDEKYALALVSAAGKTNMAWEIYDEYFKKKQDDEPSNKGGSGGGGGSRIDVTHKE